MIDETTVATSSWWDKHVSHPRILDPDGWDRANWDWSWERELITEREFFKRVSLSTVSTTKEEREAT